MRMWSAERSRWQDQHVRTPVRQTSCATAVESSPSMRWKMSVARNVICWRRLDCFRQIRRAATVVDGVDEAAQLELCSAADRQPMQLDRGRRDMVGATQAEHQSSSCILDALYNSGYSVDVNGGSTLEQGHRPLQIMARPPNLAVLLTHCGQLILRNTSKFDAIRCQILRLQCAKFDFRWRCALDPAGGAYSAPPDP